MPDSVGSFVEFFYYPVLQNESFSKPKICRVIGTAGTVTTLAAIINNVVPYEAKKIHGITLKLNEIIRCF